MSARPPVVQQRRHHNQVQPEARESFVKKDFNGTEIASYLYNIYCTIFFTTHPTPRMENKEANTEATSDSTGPNTKLPSSKFLQWSFSRHFRESVVRFTQRARPWQVSFIFTMTITNTFITYA